MESKITVDKIPVYFSNENKNFASYKLEIKLQWVQVDQPNRIITPQSEQE